jgi:hypothetical protein
MRSCEIPHETVTKIDRPQTLLNMQECVREQHVRATEVHARMAAELSLVVENLRGAGFTVYSRPIRGRVHLGMSKVAPPEISIQPAVMAFHGAAYMRQSRCHNEL